MLRVAGWMLVAGVIASASGCAAPQRVVCAHQPVANPAGVVFVADGAGDFRAASHALRQAAADERREVDVETFVWSHGPYRIVADQMDRAHSRAEGQRLAQVVLAQRAAFPDTPIYFVGHSAGCFVVLAAAEALPAGSVDRIVLLAPSAPVDYDLRPVLRCARDGVDVFCSKVDFWYLRVWVPFMTALQGKWCGAAGYCGFELHAEKADDARCYAKLRHHPWQPYLAWTGNDGGHYGCYQQTFLKLFVLPLFEKPGSGSGQPYSRSLVPNP